MKWHRIAGVYLRYFYTLKKGILMLSDLFYWPLVDILLWGLTSVWIQSQSEIENLPLILMTGLIFWQIAWRGSIDISSNLLQEFWHHNLSNIFSTPLKISEWIMGLLLLCLSKLCITIAFGSLAIYLLYSLNVYTVGWAFLPFTVSLIIFGWTLSFFSSGAIILWGHRIEMIAWMIAYIFAPFSAVFYPVSTLPLWAQKISWCLPTTYIFEGMRSILYSGHFPTHYFWISIALNLLYLAASIAFFRFMFEQSRKRGLGTLT